MAVAAAHADGKEAYARGIATELLEDFLAVEERFGAAREATEQEVIDSLRQVRRSVAPGSGLGTTHPFPFGSLRRSSLCLCFLVPKLSNLHLHLYDTLAFLGSVQDRSHAISALP